MIMALKAIDENNTLFQFSPEFYAFTREASQRK